MSGSGSLERESSLRTKGLDSLISRPYIQTMTTNKIITAADLANYVDDLVTLTQGDDGVYRTAEEHATKAQHNALALLRNLQESGRKL